jgi:maleylpyruvate isomerase
VTLRTDRATDPQVLADLADARLGQAFFSRALNNLRNDSFTQPSALPAWSRAHVVAHVGYHARALERLVECAETGTARPAYADPAARDAEIDLGATLSTRALRHLSDHAAIALDVAWRDLPPELWSTQVHTGPGRRVAISDTVWTRAREVWVHAIDLRSGAAFGDLPGRVCVRLLGDVLAAWAERPEPSRPRVVLHALDTEETFEEPRAGDALHLVGRRPSLLAWATGRSAVGVTTADGGAPPDAPRWL